VEEWVIERGGIKSEGERGVDLGERGMKYRGREGEREGGGDRERECENVRGGERKTKRVCESEGEGYRKRVLRESERKGGREGRKIDKGKEREGRE
jgi:hypothetical protein